MASLCAEPKFWHYLENVAHLEVVMKLVGLAICLGSIIGAAATVGFHLYFDILSLLFVLGGAIGFLIMKGNPENHMKNFGDGAVYFGWLGTLVGLIAITGNRFLVWGDIEKMGPALTVSMLPILYGYTARLISVALSRD
jgi:flagellar motor component MotA